MSFEIIRDNVRDYEILIENEKVIGKNKIGTEAFMSLEALMRIEKQGFTVDIWSVGVILFQILSKKYCLFNNMTFARPISYKPRKYNRIVSFILELALIFGTEEMTLIVNKFGNFLGEINLIFFFLGYDVEFPEDLPGKKPDWNFFFSRKDIYNKDAYDLVERLLEIDPEKRLSAKQALKHKFFTDYS